MGSLAIIPARGGSKRLPGKNSMPLAGRPLIHYTLNAALMSGSFEQIMFSSDSDELLEVAGELEGITLEKRAPALAGDTVKVIDTVCEIAEREKVHSRFDTIALLLPTCPFRCGTDIRNGFALLDENVDSVVSITSFEFPVSMSMRLNEESRELDFLFNPSPLVTGNTRSQDHQTVYRPNGGFYIAWTQSLRKQGNFFRGKVRGYAMPREYSVDIDTSLDLKYAELLLEEKIVVLES